VAVQSLTRMSSRRENSIREIRRAELSVAAFEAVVRYGIRKTTLEKVGVIAGVSKGVVLHHFSDKSSLLEAVFRRSNKILSESLIELYGHTESSYERLWAIVVANFCETIFNRKVCQAYVSLSAEIPHSSQCQRIQTACNARIQSNLRHELKHFLPPEECKRSAQLLGMLIDGIWIRGGLDSTTPLSNSAISDMEYAILKFLPNDKNSVEKHRMAREKMEHIATMVLGSRAYKEKALSV